jgi:hypothetical protein
MKQLVTLLFTIFCLNSGICQTTVKVIDAATREALPHADIRIGMSESVITNTEGYFTIPANTTDDTEVIASFLGYKSTGATVTQLKDTRLIKLEPGIFEIDEVAVSDNRIIPDSIIATAKRNLVNNYKLPGENVKNTLFYRQSTTFKPTKLNLTITQSTGMSKKDLKQVNGRLKTFTTQLVNNPPTEFTDMLCNYYSGIKHANGKKFGYSKLEVLKAVKLKDRNKAVTVEEMQELAEGMLYEHIDTTKYYRLKSGLFGSRDTISFRKDGGRKKKAENPRLSSARNQIVGYMHQNNFQYSTNLDFIRNNDAYEYEYEGAVPSGSGDGFVYILHFKPKKRRAKYTGTVYISETDYAVVRADYRLADGKKLGGVNLKLLLGVKQSENVSRGTVIYKAHRGGGYYLQYALEETGQYVYINRPLKLIELTDDDRDKVAFDLKVETTITDTQEYFNMARTEVTGAEAEQVKEKDFNYLQLQRYDPSIWKEYSTIEPLEEMKQFKTGS